MTETLTAPTVITEPGLYPDLPIEAYHADPVPGGSLSSSGARRLLPPSCPAKFQWEREHPQAPKEHFDIGTAAHKLVLGTGPELRVIEHDVWNTNVAKAEVAKARAEGAIPLKAAQYAEIQAMAAALREHPIASMLLDPESGRAEQSIFWRDERTDVCRRARPDWLPYERGGRLIVPDYKTTDAADTESVGRSVQKYGYHQQADWYLDGIAALGLGDPAANAFVFVFQEKSPPYLVNVVELNETALAIGRALNRSAIEMFRDCTESGFWPGYSEEIETAVLPAWAERRDLEQQR